MCRACSEVCIFFFFFSSRRRHTRLQGDWSSDVCSSDLDTPTPAGGEILRDRDGSPTGIFKDQAEGLIGKAIPDATPELTDSALARALRYAASLGVTATSHVSAGWDDLASWHRLERAGRLTMRVTLYMPLSSWRAVAESVAAHGAGDDWVRIGGPKGFMDGSAGSRTAHFFEPYAGSARHPGLFQDPQGSNPEGDRQPRSG